jgi:hypothetical protein
MRRGGCSPSFPSSPKKLSSPSSCKKERKKIWRIYVLKDPNKGEGKGMKRFNRFTHHFKKKKLTETIVRRGMRLGFCIKKVNPAYTSVIGRFKYMKKYGLSVHESAALVIGRRGLGYQEQLPKELIDIIKTKVKRHLIAMLGSMEESYKQSKSGKKQRQYIAMMLRKIENFKQEHEWSLWNILHKFCWMNQYQIQLREV